VVEQENSARAAAVGTAHRAYVDRVGATMERMRAAIARARRDFFGLDHFDDLRRARVRLGIDDVDARGAQAGHQQVTALDVRMGRIGAERRAASVPSEMMQFIAGIRHFEPSDHAGEARRPGIEVEHIYRVALSVLGIETEGRDVAQALARPFDRHSRRRIKGLVGFPKHGVASFNRLVSFDLR
jgi:hypothetical protein